MKTQFSIHFSISLIRTEDSYGKWIAPCKVSSMDTTKSHRFILDFSTENKDLRISHCFHYPHLIKVASQSNNILQIDGLFLLPIKIRLVSKSLLFLSTLDRSRRMVVVRKKKLSFLTCSFSSFPRLCVYGWRTTTAKTVQQQQQQ